MTALDGMCVCEVALAGMLRQEATGTHELLMSQHGKTQERV